MDPRQRDKNGETKNRPSASGERALPGIDTANDRVRAKTCQGSDYGFLLIFLLPFFGVPAFFAPGFFAPPFFAPPFLAPVVASALAGTSRLPESACAISAFLRASMPSIIFCRSESVPCAFWVVLWKSLEASCARMGAVTLSAKSDAAPRAALRTRFICVSSFLI